MRLINVLNRATRISLLTASILSNVSMASPPNGSLKLYTLDCGQIAVADMGAFDDSGASHGKSSTLPSPCYLIRHPKGDLLWDAGIGDEIAKEPGGRALLPGFIATVPKTLQSQLAQLSLDPKNIKYFAFSHAHVDHLGNANLLGSATWIVNRLEMEFIEKPGNESIKAMVGSREQTRTIYISGDYDVFGDGSVMILSTRGHTPGHQSLLVKLKQKGPILLSGDIYHSRYNRKYHRVPIFNSSRPETLASMDRVEQVLSAWRAKLVIQHAQEDFDAAPKVPRFDD